MNPLRLIILICFLLLISAKVNAQVVDAKHLNVYKQAGQESQSLLNRLLTEDPLLAQMKSGIEMRKAKLESKDVLPNPELGIYWSPVPMQKALNQTVAVRAMQPFPWPGTIQSSVEIEHIQVQLEQLNWLQQSNERMMQVQLLLAERERILKQAQLLEKQLGWIESLKRELQTRLKLENVRKSVLELEIEEQTLLQKKQEWQLLKRSNEFEIRAYFANSIILPDSILINAEIHSYSENNPLLEAARIKEKLGNNRKKLAVLEGKPMIALGAEYMWIQEAMPIMAPEMQMQPAFTVMASINLPVYRKKYKGMKAEAHQAEKMAEFEYETIKKKLYSRFQVLMEQKKLKEKELKLAESIIPNKLRELSNLEREKWETGGGNMVSWIQIERRLLEQESIAITTRIDLKKINIELAGLVAWEN